LLAGLLLAAGCQPLNESRDVKLKEQEAKSLLFDAPRYDQKVTVEVQSPGSGVTAYLMKEADHEKAEVELLTGKTPAGALGGKDNAEDISFTATVPAGTPFAVVLYNPRAREITVKLKVKGR
jgi:hypothetical protein